MATKNPEFSVVIVAYNHAKYLAAAVASVLNQTYPDFEVIVFDDGSTDNSREIVSSIADKRVKYVYQKNSGLPACARNKAISLSCGKYIAILDGDDFWHEQKLAKCRKALDTNPQVSLICHNEGIVYDNKVIRFTSCGPYSENMYEKLLFKGNCLHTSAVVIRRDVFFRDNFIFSEKQDLYTIEDYDFWLRLSQVYRFLFLPEVLGYYRITETGAFLRNAEKGSLNMLNLLDSHFERFTSLNNKMRLKMKKRRSSVMSAAGRMYQHNNDFKKSREWYIRAISEYLLNYKAIIGFLSSAVRLRIIYR